MTEVSAVDVARLERLEAQATSGPWRAEQDGGNGTPERRDIVYVLGRDRALIAATQTLEFPSEGVSPHADAEFIAAARTAAPSLLAAYRERDELRETVEEDAQKIDRLHRAWLAVDALFSGGPDTACRTVWQDGIECVSVPLADLRAALDGVE